MKHYEHPQLVKKVDNSPLSSLKTKDRDQVIFRCEECGVECESSYSAFLQKKIKLCKHCSKERSKGIAKNRMLDRWKDENYRSEISKKVSEGQKNSWKNKKRRKPQKEKYYWELKRLLEQEDYKLLTDLESYLINDAWVDYECPNRHTSQTTYKRWNKGCDRCKKCKEDEERNTLDKSAKLAGFEIVEIKGSTVIIKCPNGHVSEILKYNLYNLQGCGKCNHEGKSFYEENLLAEFLDSLNIDYIKNTREIISPYELDLYVPEKRLAIEYDGYPFHTEMYGKGKNDHRLKTMLCERQNIQLIHVFYDELLFNEEKTLNRLKFILGKEDRKIYARKCAVKEITRNEAKDFCEKHHLQNYQSSRVKLGLFHEEDLVSVMTFSKFTRGKDNEGAWELSRFATKYNVVGGAGKLLSYFKSNHDWEEIITYADRRWSQGNLYYKLGFQFMNYTEPDYFYINKNSKTKEREHRFNYRKNKIKHLAEGETEKEIMSNLNYTRMWGCGHMKFRIERE